MSIYSFYSSKRLCSALVFSLILSACGGGGGGGSDTQATSDSPAVANPRTGNGETTPPVTQPGTPEPTRPSQPDQPTEPTQPASLIIDYYGDSTVWGYGTNTGVRVANPAPAAFAAALPNPSRYTVRNEGVNSSTSCGLLNGQDGKHPNWDKQMAASNAHVVIINHAINDQWAMDVNTYKSCLNSLASKAKSYGKKVVFETPNPTRDSGPNSLDVYVNAMKSVAAQQGVPVIDQYAYLLNHLNGQSPYTICPDGLHPTDAVYVMKGKYAASTFAKLGY